MQPNPLNLVAVGAEYWLENCTFHGATNRCSQDDIRLRRWRRCICMSIQLADGAKELLFLCRLKVCNCRWLESREAALRESGQVCLSCTVRSCHATVRVVVYYPGVCTMFVLPCVCVWGAWLETTDSGAALSECERGALRREGKLGGSCLQLKSFQIASCQWPGAPGPRPCWNALVLLSSRTTVPTP